MELLIENNTSIDNLKMSQQRFKEIADLSNMNKAKIKKKRKKGDLERISNFIPQFLVEKFASLKQSTYPFYQITYD